MKCGICHRNISFGRACKVLPKISSKFFSTFMQFLNRKQKFNQITISILFSKWKVFSYYFRFSEVWQTLLSPQPDFLSLKRPDKGTPHFHSPLGLEALPYSILCHCFFSPGWPESGLQFFQRLTEPLHCASPTPKPPPLASLSTSGGPLHPPLRVSPVIIPNSFFCSLTPRRGSLFLPNALELSFYPFSYPVNHFIPS